MTPERTDPKSSQRSRRMHVLRIVIGLSAISVLVGIIYYLGPMALAQQLLQAGPGFLWLLVLHAAGIAISGLAWHVLLPKRARPTPWQSIASRFVAAGANAVTPVVSFAGDLVRLFWLPHKADRPHGVAAIVVDRLTYGAANTLLVIAGVFALVHVGLPPEYMRMTMVGMAILILLVGAGAILASRYRVVGRVHHLISRLRKKERDHQFGDDVDASTHEMLRRKPAALAAAFGCNVLYRIAMSAQVVLAFHLLGVDLPWDQAIVFCALPIVIATGAFFIPSQLGLQEGAQALLAASFGIPQTTAVAVVLLLRIRSLVGGALVALLIATKKSSLETASAGGDLDRDVERRTPSGQHADLLGG